MRLAIARKLGCLLLAPVLLFALGCGGAKSVEGSTPVPSSEVLKHNQGTKSPPAQKPPG